MAGLALRGGCLHHVLLVILRLKHVAHDKEIALQAGSNESAPVSGDVGKRNRSRGETRSDEARVSGGSGGQGEEIPESYANACATA